MSSDIITQLPLDVKEKLVRLSNKLPENKRSQFLSGVSDDLFDLAQEFIEDNKWTLVYGAIGFALGLVLDEVLKIHVPFGGTISITMGWAKWLGLAGGGIHGFQKDRETERIRKIVQDQLIRAQSSN